MALLLPLARPFAVPNQTDLQRIKSARNAPKPRFKALPQIGDVPASIAV